MERKSLKALSPLGFHRLSYLEWTDVGDDRTPVLCLHGLTRNALDFEPLGEALTAGGRRVAALDVVGRGQSDWLSDPAHYGYPQYLSDAAAWIARLGAPQVDIVGTSMGGLIGMMLAAQPGNPVRRLVMNDVGPFIPKAALQRIAAYLERPRRFASLAEAEAHLRQAYAPFAFRSDDGWRRFIRNSLVEDGDGALLPAYDQRIGSAFVGADLEDVDLWPVWEQVMAKVLVLRGAESDLLLGETAVEMQRRGRGCALVELSGHGHAPPLVEEYEIGPILQFLGKE